MRFCLNSLPSISAKGLTIVKEAEEGFDKLCLSEMHDHLAERLSKEFPGKVALGKIVPLPKGREVMLEGADIIAGGMLRRTLYKGSNPKDVLEGLKTQPTTAQFSKCTFEVSNIIGFNIKAENNDAMGRTSNNTAASF